MDEAGALALEPIEKFIAQKIQVDWAEDDLYLPEIKPTSEERRRYAEEKRQRMAARGGGLICAFGSVAGDRARRSNYLYGASKAGLSVFLDGLGLAYADRGVRVLAVTDHDSTEGLAEAMAALYEDDRSVASGLGRVGALLRGLAKLDPRMDAQAHLLGALARGRVLVSGSAPLVQADAARIDAVLERFLGDSSSAAVQPTASIRRRACSRLSPA